MPCPEVTYGLYSEEFGRSASSEEFRECLPFARALVDRLTYPNRPVTDGQRRAYALAVCAAVEADAATGCGHGLDEPEGFSIGSFSVSGGSTSLRAMEGAARAMLTGSGLLYMGLGPLC